MRVCEDGLFKRKFALATEPSRSKRPAKSGLRHSSDPNNRIAVTNRQSARNLDGDFFSWMDGGSLNYAVELTHTVAPPSAFCSIITLTNGRAIPLRYAGHVNSVQPVWQLVAKGSD